MLRKKCMRVRILVNLRRGCRQRTAHPLLERHEARLSALLCAFAARPRVKCILGWRFKAARSLHFV